MSCPDCFSGSVHTGAPVGTITTIHGLPTYVARPPEGVTPKGLVIFLSDAFGWEFVNNRLLADRYAESGFLVYLPDYLNGHAMPSDFMELLDEKIKAPAPSWFTAIVYKPIYIARAIRIIIPWVLFSRDAVVRPRIFNFFKAIRTSPTPFSTDNLKIGVAGFCIGGRYAILLAHDKTQPLIDCAFAAHPSRVEMPNEIEGVNVPLSVAIGDEDMAMKKDLIIQMKEILKAKEEDHEVVIMPGASHGFAIRVNPKDKLQMECADKAELQATSWFSKWLA